MTDSGGGAWDLVREWLRDATPVVEVVRADPSTAREQLRLLHLTERSVLGALALNTGGLLIDHGWLRVLGSGADALPGLADLSPTTGHLVVAYDVLGGRFAVDGGGLGIEPGEVCYFAPDTLAWEGTGLGHADFVRWSLSGRTAAFYESMRWPGWEQEVARLRADQGLAVVPPLFAAEGRPIDAASRATVPIEELFAFHEDVARQLAALPAGQTFRIVLDE